MHDKATRDRSRAAHKCVDPVLDTLDKSARHMASYVDPLLPNCERAAKPTPFSVGAAGHPLCAHEKRAPSRRAARRRNLLLAPRGPQAARLTWIQAASTGGVRARLRCVAGCATPTGSAGHPGETANLKLIFHLDHSAGADQSPFPAFTLARHLQNGEPRAAFRASSARILERAFLATWAFIKLAWFSPAMIPSWS